MSGYSHGGKSRNDKSRDDDGIGSHSNNDKKDGTILGSVMETVTDLFKSDGTSLKYESEIHVGKHDHTGEQSKEKTGIYIPGDNDKKICNHGSGGVTIDGDSNAPISNT